MRMKRIRQVLQSHCTQQTKNDKSKWKDYIFYSNKRAEHAKIATHTEISTENEGSSETEIRIMEQRFGSWVVDLDVGEYVIGSCH